MSGDVSLKTRSLVRFTVLGDPRKLALQRHRTGRNVFAHDTTRNESSKHLVVASALAAQPAPRVPSEAALCLSMIAHMPIPRSWSKTKQRHALVNEILPKPKPDASNMLKLVEDALEGIYYRNDSQFCTEHLRKRFSERPRLEVAILEYEEA